MKFENPDCERDKVISEARARIIWGEPSLSVRGFLVANGFSDSVARAKIEEFILERNTEIRRRGIKGVLTGVTLIGASGGVLFWLMFEYGSRFVVVWFTRGVIPLVIIGLYGIWKLLRGIIYLVRPQAVHKSIPDITE